MTSRAAVQHELESDPLARGSLATLTGAALAAALLALLGLALLLAGDARDEGRELFDLEAQGAGPRTLRRHLRLRAGLVAALGPRRGARDRGAALVLAVDLVTLTANASAPEPPLALSRELAARRPPPAPPTPRPPRALIARGHEEGGMSAIEVRDLFRVFSTPEGDAAALQGLTLAVEEREVLVVLGPSGSGKSTLLRILAGLERPSAGTARVFGADLGRLGGRRLADYRARVLGYVEQHYSRSLDPDLTARELVGVQLGLAGAGRAERDRRADELLERVGLAGKRDAYPRELSGGERQRIAVCAALAHRPSLLLADEPTGELDAANATLVSALLGELAREHGCTTVVVSHDVETTAIADRTIRVRDGRVSEEGAGNGGGEEALVVGKGGWVRLPEELVLRAGLGDRARAALARRGDRPQPDRIRARERGGACRPAGRRAGGRPRGRRDARAAQGLRRRRSRESVVLAGLDASFQAGRLVAITGPSGSGQDDAAPLPRGTRRSRRPARCSSSARLWAGSTARRGRPCAATRWRSSARTRASRRSSPRGRTSSWRSRCGASPTRRRASAPSTRSPPVGLAERSEQRVARLSAGERQRVAIARAVAAGPSLLLADEPTARLDEANALAVGALFARLARETGAAVVCATHDPLVVEQADAELALR